MINHYETVFIVDPVLSDEKIKETVETVKNLLTDTGGKVLFEESWGIKKLAYPIKKKHSGYYFLLEFELEGTSLKKIDTYFNRNEGILRHLVVKFDKFAIEYAKKRREEVKNFKKEEK